MMNFHQLHILLGSPRVQYLKWEDDQIYTTYIELLAEDHPDPDGQNEELCPEAKELVDKFIAQVKDKFGIVFTPAELGEVA
jgi:hypothetical protein